MKAVILAGGFATRLRPLSCTRPKILFPIINKPLLQWTFERLARNDIKEAILAANYQTEAAVKQHRIPRMGVHVIYSRDPLRKPLGTGGPIKRAEKQIGRESSFLVLNGDIFADVNYREVLKMHEKKDAVATLSLHRVEDPSRYGVAELAKDNRIERFIEKPSRGEAPTDLINAGAYVLNPEIFSYIPPNRAVSIEREVFPKLAEEGTLYGYVYQGLWSDIGKPKDYMEINRTLLDSLADQALKTPRRIETRKPVALDKRISIGENSTVGPYAILGRDVIVGDNVHIQNSVILQGTEIADSVSIDGAIVGEGVFIEKGVKIGTGCIIGDHARIKENVKLAKEVSVCPAKEISESVFAAKCIF